MREINMNRLELLAIVQSNLKKHIFAYEDAVEDYKRLVIAIAATNLKLAKTSNLDEIKKIRQIPSAPVSYEREYARAIRMIELSVDENIPIEEDVFNQLVMDEWHWKASFTAASALYKQSVF